MTKFEMARVVVTALYDLPELATEKNPVAWRHIQSLTNAPKDVVEDQYKMALNALESRGLMIEVDQVVAIREVDTMTHHKACELFNDKLKDLELKPLANVWVTDIKTEGAWCKIADVAIIDHGNLGYFIALFKHVEIGIAVNKHGGDLHLLVEYHYKHYNDKKSGHTCRFVYDDKKVWRQYD